MFAALKKKISKLAASAPSLSTKNDANRTEPLTTADNNPTGSSVSEVSVPSTKPVTQPKGRPPNIRSSSTGDLTKLASTRSQSSSDSNPSTRRTSSPRIPSQRSRTAQETAAVQSWRRSVVLPDNMAPNSGSPTPDKRSSSQSWKRASFSHVSTSGSSPTGPTGRNPSSTSPQAKRASFYSNRNVPGPNRRNPNEPNNRSELISDRRRSFAPEVVAAAAKSDAFYQRSVEETRREEKNARLRNAVASKPTSENVESHAYFQNNIVQYRKESEEGRRRANFNAMIQATVPTARPSAVSRSASNEQTATLSRQQMGQPLIVPDLVSGPAVDWHDAYGMPPKRGHGERRHSSYVGRNQDALRPPPPLFY